jgi:hypothetical protein
LNERGRKRGKRQREMVRRRRREREIGTKERDGQKERGRNIERLCV